MCSTAMVHTRITLNHLQFFKFVIHAQFKSLKEFDECMSQKLSVKIRIDKN